MALGMQPAKVEKPCVARAELSEAKVPYCFKTYELVNKIRSAKSLGDTVESHQVRAGGQKNNYSIRVLGKNNGFSIRAGPK
jgi:hypothetical protein